MGWKRLHDLKWGLGGTISTIIESTQRKAWVTSCEALWAIPLHSISVHTRHTQTGAFSGAFLGPGDMGYLDITTILRMQRVLSLALRG